MICDGKVAHITLNCLHEERYKTIQEVFAKNKFSVSVLYLSNILKSFKKGGTYGQLQTAVPGSIEEETKKFWKNQLLLCNDNTLILNTEADPNHPESAHESPQADEAANRPANLIQAYSPKNIRDTFLPPSLAL
jgi:hypothetical protein